MKKHQLTHNGELIFEGTEDQCYKKLLRSQSQSTLWAIRHEGWKIEPTDEDIEDPKKEAIFIKKECDTAVCHLNGEVVRIDKRHIYAILGSLVEGEKFFIDSTYIQKHL